MSAAGASRPVAAILVGGASRRMGEPKHALVMPDGRCMIEHVRAAMAPLCESTVVVGAAAPPVAGLPVVEDLRVGAGPLGGIEALLASGRGARYLVCPCDVPMITHELLERLVAAPPAPVAVARLAEEPWPRPLPLRIDAAALPVVSAILDSGRHAVHQLLDAVETAVVEMPAEYAGQLANVNHPEEYERLRGE